MKKTIASVVILFCIFIFNVFPQKTQNVIIVVVDGSRCTETFDDKEHKYIPNIWNKLRPLGTICTNMYIDGWTKTIPGHSAIVTGTWQEIANDGTERPHQPTIFEYLRKDRTVPQNKLCVVTGKEKLEVLGHSDHPIYGARFSASVVKSNPQGNDTVTMKDVFELIKNNHPKVMVVNLAQTDKSGHNGIFNEYTASVRRADSLIYLLWETIQSDSLYKDKTTMIVTNDHGRHSDNVLTGFKDHGDNCKGCRHIMFLAIGPDTPAGVTDTQMRMQIDIAPTVALLLKFMVPFSEGDIIDSAVDPTIEPVKR